jgi:pyruvate dehydrogenase E1 component alpha subunit
VRRRSAISTVFFGDGATEAGIFHESLNFAAVHRLAVLFVCENNLYSIYSSLAPRQPVGRRIADVASAMGVRSKRIDGQDVETVYEAAREEVARLRSGDGPGFLECLTYRFVQHVGPGGDDHLAYRPHDEIAHWKAHDPLTIARARAVDAGLAREAEVEAWSKTFEDEVSAAIRDSAAGAPDSRPSESDR